MKRNVIHEKKREIHEKTVKIQKKKRAIHATNVKFMKIHEKK